MAFLKKPFVAVILCLLAIVLTTFISVNRKLGSQCNDVIDGFYTGQLSSGVTEDSLFSQIGEIKNCADELVLIASKYDIDSEALKNAVENLQNGLTYSHNDISYLYYLYDDISVQLRTLKSELAAKELSTEDAAITDDLFNSINKAQTEIKSSAYNESVRLFMREYEKFPTSLLGDFAGVDTPDYFS